MKIFTAVFDSRNLRYALHLRNTIVGLCKFCLSVIAPQNEIVRALARLAAHDIARLLPPAENETGDRHDCNLRRRRLSALFAYEDNRVKLLIWEIKYRKNAAIAEKIGVLLYEKMILQMQAEKWREATIAPIPSHHARRRERGFNQCEIVCAAIMRAHEKAGAIEKTAKKGGEMTDKSFVGENAPYFLNYEPHLLTKIKNTPHQADLPRAERLKNVRGSFAAPAPEKVRGKIIFIVDDVITTGATIGEAQATLLAAGARIVRGFSIAH